MDAPSAPPADFQRLLAAARQGDAGALGRLLVELRPYLLMLAGQALKAGGPVRNSAEDIVQEAIVQAFRHFGQFDGATPEELRGWLRRIVLNQQRDSGRHARADRRAVQRERSVEERPHGVPDEDPIKARLVARAALPVADLIRREKIATIRTALGLLSADHQSVILLRCEEDLPFEEIGQRLGRSSEAARKLWERALADLKRHLRLMREEDSDFQDRP